MPDGWDLNIRKKCIECLSYSVNYTILYYKYVYIYIYIYIYVYIYNITTNFLSPQALSLKY